MLDFNLNSASTIFLSAPKLKYLPLILQLFSMHQITLCIIECVLILCTVQAFSKLVYFCIKQDKIFEHFLILCSWRTICTWQGMYKVNSCMYKTNA